MEHINILNQILQGIQENKTLSGTLYGPESVTPQIRVDASMFQDNIMWAGDINGEFVLYFGGHSVVDYMQLCDNFIFSLTHYIVSLQERDRPEILNLLLKTITDTDVTLKLIEIAPSERIQIEKKILKLQEKCVLPGPELFDTDFFIEVLRTRRFVKRRDVISFLKIEITKLCERYTQVTSIPHQSKKIAWSGTPAQFGFILRELIDKGYISIPSSVKSYIEQARYLKDFFDVNTSVENMRKELSTEQNSMVSKNQLRFRIPCIDSLNSRNQNKTGE